MPIDDSTKRVRHTATFGALLAGTLAASGLSGALTLRLDALASGHTGPWRVEAAVELAVIAAGLVVALWLAMSTLVAAACVVTRAAGARWRAGERLVQRCAPGVVRQALVLVVGASVGIGMASGASAAAPEPTPSASSSVAPAVGADDLGWAVTTPTVEDAAVDGPAESSAPPARSTADVEPVSSAAADGQAAAGPSSSTPAPSDAVVGTDATGAQAASGQTATAGTAGTTTDAGVVVAAGDSLWAIAARHLPPDASDAQIAAAWPQWYRANAATIGADPDLITPGQVLTVPSSLAGVSS